MRLGLITRCRNEPYINEFVNHYLNEGVDKIYIIDDHSKEGLYDRVADCTAVQIITDIPFSNGSSLNILYKKIKDDCDWILVVDVDEFVTTIRNKKKTLKDELLTTFKDVDCVKIPWVMMSFNGLEKNPDCLLETNIYRWNHDKKHSSYFGEDFRAARKFRCRYDEIEVKSVLKTRSFRSYSDHMPHGAVSKTFKIVDSVCKSKGFPWIRKLLDRPLVNLCPPGPYYKQLREADISQAVLLCFHYRVASKQQCVDKTTDNHFSDYRGIRAEDFINSDFPEKIDRTLCLKSKQRPKRFAK